MVRVRIRYKRRRLSVEVHHIGFFRRGLGLMFRTRETKNLLFTFSRPCRVSLTSWFVFFPFLAVWLDARGSVIETRMIRPFTLTIVPKHNASSLIELPYNSRNKRIISFLVGK